MIELDKYHIASARRMTPELEAGYIDAEKLPGNPPEEGHNDWVVALGDGVPDILLDSLGEHEAKVMAEKINIAHVRALRKAAPHLEDDIRKVIAEENRQFRLQERFLR